MALSQSRHSSRIRLSPKEILIISEEINRVYNPKFSSSMSGSDSDVKLSAQDMLAISEEISREFAVRPPRYTPESVCVLMPVDPERVHAYWHLDKKQQETVEQSSAEDGLVLRIFSRPDKATDTVQSDQYFDVICDRSKTQQTISLPPAYSANQYSAAIGQCHSGQQFVAFACSDITYLPRTTSAPIHVQKQNTVNATVSHFLNQNHSGKGKTQI